MSLKYDPNWQPNAAQVLWTQGLIAQMRDGGVWVLPVNGNVYKFDKTRKVLELLQGQQDEWHRRTVITFQRLGWTVTPAGGAANADELALNEAVWNRCSTA